MNERKMLMRKQSDDSFFLYVSLWELNRIFPRKRMLLKAAQ